MKLGDTVQVISRISPHYRETGQVCNVTELRIEVKGEVTKVCAP